MCDEKKRQILRKEKSQSVRRKKKRVRDRETEKTTIENYLINYISQVNWVNNIKTNPLINHVVVFTCVIN